FGHMWELYTFWAFVPIMLLTYVEVHAIEGVNIPLWSFLIIGLGGLACVIGGYLAQEKGTEQIACLALLLSCVCCLLSPLAFIVPSKELFIAFLLFWGMVVIADSPLFSTLVAECVSPEIKGTALTIVNSIGYVITIVSIQLISIVRTLTDSRSIYLLLAIGPILGLWALRGNKRSSN
ncbi:MAG: MFS transporter, partial [Bacteroidota bacterium]